MLCQVQLNFAHPGTSGSKSLVPRFVEIKGFENWALDSLDQVFRAFLALGTLGWLQDIVCLAGRLFHSESIPGLNLKHLNEFDVQSSGNVELDILQPRLERLYLQPSSAELKFQPGSNAFVIDRRVLSQHFRLTSLKYEWKNSYHTWKNNGLGSWG